MSWSDDAGLPVCRPVSRQDSISPVGTSNPFALLIVCLSVRQYVGATGVKLSRREALLVSFCSATNSQIVVKNVGRWKPSHSECRRHTTWGVQGNTEEDSGDKTVEIDGGACELRPDTQRVFLWPTSGCLRTDTQLLPHRQVALPDRRVWPTFRGGTRVLGPRCQSGELDLTCTRYCSQQGLSLSLSLALISHTYRYDSPSYHSRQFLCYLTCKCLWISGH